MKFWPRFSPREWSFLICLVILYFASRLYHLTALPIFVDEAIYSRWAQISLHDASWRFISLTDGKQPLFIWISMATLKYLADPLFATRLVSVISGLFTVLGLIYAGHLLGSKKLGFLAAYLSLITPFLFFYDRFAVVESMLTASGVWLFNLGFLLISTARLDVALILGLFGGLALLVKSPALIYLLLIPLSYPFLVKSSELWHRRTLKFLLYLLLAYFLAAAIYNIQRLSPWMHMIGDKNNDFVISPLTMLLEHPYRIWQNFADAQSWLWSYLTLPLYGLSILGGLWLLKSDWRRFFVVSAWFWGPLLATVLSAMLFRPRYIVFAVPFMLFYGAYALVKLPRKFLLPVLLTLTIWPTWFMYQSWTNPLHMPLVRADFDYVSGWASGNGVKEISAWLVARSLQVNQSLDVYTEGTFGLLPHGVELYTADRTKKLQISGIYPIRDIPPLAVRQNAEKNSETYFILNNTQVKSLPPNSEEILAFPKADQSYIRLYRISP